MEEQTHSLYMKVLGYIEEVFLDLDKLILPKKQHKYLPPSVSAANSLIPIQDHIFVAEKFLSTRVQPLNYKLHTSSAFRGLPEHDPNKARITKLLHWIETGESRINNPSEGFLPRSCNRFFAAEYANRTRRRYIADPSAEFFGIRHFHLGNQVDDALLFYAIAGSDCVLLSIGSHLSLYQKANVEIVIREFPQMAPALGIAHLPIHPGRETSPDEVKRLWQNGANVGFIIDGKYYLGTPMSLAGVSHRCFSEMQNLSYQIEQHSRKLLSIDDSRFSESWKMRIGNFLGDFASGVFLWSTQRGDKRSTWK